MADLTFLTEGLRFPEGPVVLRDGSVLVVEVAAGQVTHIAPDGSKTVVAEPGGGPNGQAVGPDGRLYVCNNGGGAAWHEQDGLLFRGPFDESLYDGGRVDRVDIETGSVEVLYTECQGRSLRAPNDIVFDGAGGFWFTDYGIVAKWTRDRTSIYYAKADGSSITEVISPLESPNGIALSPDGTRLYTAETFTGRVWWWEVSAPGEVVAAPGRLGHGGTLLRGIGGERTAHALDSMAVDGEGWVCVGTLVRGGITAISPDGEEVEFYPMDDIFPTNICFGGPDMKTAFVTLATTGRLASMQWPRPGLPLAFER